MIDLVAKYINRSALKKLNAEFAPFEKSPNIQEPALLVRGAFRSGTSVLTNILSRAGFDLGPPHHLLQATGKFHQYNPEGYFENYFFMELSRYIFHITGSSGDRPPSENVIAALSVNDLDDRAFHEYAIMELRESRVSNRNKVEVLRRASVKHIEAYVNNVFGKKPLIKNPHFSVLEPFFGKLFPASKRIVAFRNPSDWLRSARPLGNHVNADLYEKYYSYYLQTSGVNCIFFDYDKLLQSPETSIRILLDELGVKEHNVGQLAGIVKKKISSEPSGKHSIHQKLQSLAINK